MPANHRRGLSQRSSAGGPGGHTAGQEPRQEPQDDQRGPARQRAHTLHLQQPRLHGDHWPQQGRGGDRQVPQPGLLRLDTVARGAPALHPRREKQDDGAAQLVVEIRELQRLYPHDYLCHQTA